ncbi:hypothetical protein A2U01_0108213, partial [Trifolium medium]|nr:hypothetical protein [Trifolium medium]
MIIRAKSRFCVCCRWMRCAQAHAALRASLEQLCMFVPVTCAARR